MPKELLDDEIKYLYVEEKRSLSEVAEKVGCAVMTVQRRLKKQGVQIRTISEARLNQSSKSSYKKRYGYTTEEILELAKKMNYEEVADILGCHKDTVYQILRREFPEWSKNPDHARSKAKVKKIKQLNKRLNEYLKEKGLTKDFEAFMLYRDIYEEVYEKEKNDKYAITN